MTGAGGPILLGKGRLRARLAQDAHDLDAALALRGLCFRGDAGRPDGDAHDSLCDHVLIECNVSNALVGCFRLRRHDGASIAESYCAQFYDLSALRHFGAPMLELGRFCIHPDRQDGDILRLAWGALTREVDRQGIGLLFGSSSFAGCDPAPHLAAFAQLRDRHPPPLRWAPGVGAPEILRFAGLPQVQAPPRALPPLLRTYLAMGGWVSDHAVIDRDLGTVHVFTGLEIDRVPEGRARLLRAVAG
ncbi:GNAT family N-acetyltransferase [Oceaniglobus trochenteri]|uniref:GNAT family N-acetyltransferase n=1 Tax=Oceaniglobus trochenteri TaxID=2763260 RepID=UPI001CFFBE27|nr:GNAT family N-acyltransferase [Oceaniglobus trochenteri]